MRPWRPWPATLGTCTSRQGQIAAVENASRSSSCGDSRWSAQPGTRDDQQGDDGIETMTLWRPTGPEDLTLVEASGWREWPPRLPGQPIFYPVLNEEYATMIARTGTSSSQAPGM